MRTAYCAYEFRQMLALGLNQPLIQWVPGALSLGVKRQGREADHLLPSSAENKNAWNYTYTPPARLHGVLEEWRYSTGTTLTLHFYL
jgi:hypothetical protein